MARSRNIKPAFFKNYELADLGSVTQLLFAGLWCLADREGRLEDKPRLIKAELFPYYECDVNGELTELERLGFVRRYSVGDVAVVEVLNFKKHQTPHNTEKPSALPAFDPQSSAKPAPALGNGELTVDSPKSNDGKTPDSLIPDSLNLIPDSLTPAPAPPASPAPPQRPDKGYSDEFEAAWAEYPSRAGGNSKADAFKAWSARLKDGVSATELTDGVRRYALFVELSKTEPRFVKQAATFFGPGLHFRESWTPPSRASPPSKQSTLEARNAATAQRVMEALNVAQ